jgi:DNA-binding SARP family transcriptional activator
MEFRTLGELEVRDGENVVPIRGAVQRSVIAVLLVRANTVVRVDDLIDEVWGDHAPESAPKMVQNAVSKLRQNGLGEKLATRAGGYVLQIEPGEVDARRFEQLLDDARLALAEGDPARADALVREAEGLWRGPPFADLGGAPFAQLEIGRLEELRLEAAELAADAGLALGHHSELATRLEKLVAEHPLRERLRQQLMLSLYRSGRQAEALAAYQAARAYLRDELGLEPSPSLQRLEQAILLQDPALTPEFLAAPAPPPTLRKTVTVVHVQLMRRGRALDPETLLALATRVDELLQAGVAMHGGSALTVGGSAAVATFGLPMLAEDDALRAARSALEIRRQVAVLNETLEREWGVHYELRFGVATGTVLFDPHAQHPAEIATGEVFATASQLALSARPSEIVLEDATRRLLGPDVELETADGVELAGGADRSWRLIDVGASATATPRRLDLPLVGREWELTQLEHAFERATQANTSYLVTVLGPGGIGKSRLAREFGDARGDRANVVMGRCPSYGAGVALWPLAEIVHALTGGQTRESIAASLGDAPDGDEVAARIAGAIGAEEAAGTAADLFWAVRRLLTVHARTQPLVLVLDDLQWAQPALLDLLDNLVDALRDAPVLLLCLARAELLETRHTWGGGKLNATTILLEPLSQPELELLIEHAGGKALDAAIVNRVAQAAEGNPLFLEQMVALALEEGDPQVMVPPSIQALLAARLDRLAPSQRSVLGRASVIGRDFSLTDVAALSPEADPEAVRHDVEALVRRELLRSADAGRDGTERYRFRHGLIRDAAYEAVPKAERAALHAELARVLTGQGTRGHADEVLAFHLEQAFLYRVELGTVDRDSRALAKRATRLLAAAGRRAYARDDVAGAVAFLERAAALAGPGTKARRELLPDLGEAIRESGDYPRAEAVLAEAIAAADEAEDAHLAEYARLIRLRMRVQTDAGLSADEVVEWASSAIGVFGAVDDAQSLAKAWELLAWGHWLQCHAAAAEEALGHSLELARRAGDPRTAAQSLHLTLGAAVFGPRPVPDAIQRCEEILAHARGQRRVTASALRALAALKAMAGDFAEARVLMQRFSAIVEDLGLRVTAASASETYAAVELLAGDPAAAERRLRSGYAQLEQMGESSTSANLAALLAQALHVQGRDEEAVLVSDVTPAEDDVSAHVHLSGARARALASVGRLEEAERLARAAVARAEQTDFLAMWGDALSDLASVLRQSNRAAEARRRLGEALELYRQKQHLVAIRRTEDLLKILVRDA